MRETQNTSRSYFTGKCVRYKGQNLLLALLVSWDKVEIEAFLEFDSSLSPGLLLRLLGTQDAAVDLRVGPSSWPASNTLLQVTLLGGYGPSFPQVTIQSLNSTAAQGFITPCPYSKHRVKTSLRARKTRPKVPSFIQSSA